MDLPFGVYLKLPEGIPTKYDNHVVRRLSSMKGQFLDQEFVNKLLEKDDLLLYEVFEFHRPEVAGELLSGVTVIHPGKVGNEYFMTKGHFHTILETAEIYYCLSGKGIMVMETPEGNWSTLDFVPGRILYVPPRWAHRSVNTSLTDKLTFFFVYPGNAGHDYGTIETKGFRKLVIDGKNGNEIIDNPRWKNTGK